MNQPLDFFKEYKYDNRAFLLVGMGPSFSRINNFDTGLYNIMGINKVVRQISVDICHIIDWYIVDKVRDSIEKQAKYLVCPYYPHFGFQPNFMLPLKDISMNLPQEIKEKLLAYNLSTIKIKDSSSHIIHANYFNAEASLNLIAKLGCKTVRAIGIDGGTTRADEFSDHGPCDPRGFDLQWESMSRTIVHHGIDYQNLDGSPLNPKLISKIESLIVRSSH